MSLAVRLFRRAARRVDPRLLLVLAMLLGGCAAPPHRTADSAALSQQLQREQALSQQQHWQLDGRVAIANGRDGGSGRVVWMQRPGWVSFELQAPVSRRSWRLVVERDQARLDGLEGGPRTADDAATLLREAIGWELPLDELGEWMRGARGPGAALIEFDAEGRPAVIEQGGWRIEYRGWQSAGTPPLPTRVFASRGDQRVRMVVDRWQANAQ